jgi:hypothetical protein
MGTLLYSGTTAVTAPALSAVNTTKTIGMNRGAEFLCHAAHLHYNTANGLVVNLPYLNFRKHSFFYDKEKLPGD